MEVRFHPDQGQGLRHKVNAKFKQAMLHISLHVYIRPKHHSSVVTPSKAIVKRALLISHKIMLRYAAFIETTYKTLFLYNKYKLENIGS